MITFTEDKVEANSCKVTTLEFKYTLLKVCDSRLDSWAETVKSRILSVHDLPVANAIYHHQCYRNFKTNESLKPYSIKTSNEPDKTI